MDSSEDESKYVTDKNGNSIDYDEAITNLLRQFIESSTEPDAASDTKVRRLSLLRLFVTDSRSSHFWEPVTGVTGYSKVIKTPMDLNSISQRVLEDAYASDKSFVDDVKLVWKNCKLFNGPGALFTDHAVACEKKFKKFHELWISSPQRPVDCGDCFVDTP